MKLQQLKEQFTRLTGVEAKAKPTRSYLTENQLYKLATLDLRRKDTWQAIVDEIERYTYTLQMGTQEYILNFLKHTAMQRQDLIELQGDTIMYNGMPESEAVDYSRYTKPQIANETHQQLLYVIDSYTNPKNELDLENACLDRGQNYARVISSIFTGYWQYMVNPKDAYYTQLHYVPDHDEEIPF